MKNEAQKDLFAHKSKSWDMSSRRVKNAKSIAATIVENIPLKHDMHLLDVGAGTGLLSFFLSQKVGKITALDSSPSMLEVFKEKREEFSCPTDVLFGDVMQLDENERYDGIVSSMTIHHIQEIDALFKKLYGVLKPGGFIAIADLEKEDGSFHSDNEGVYHFGFESDELIKLAKEAGFQNVTVHHASTITKPHRAFDIFLLTGVKG
jgi:ubiquinone/menaquinone biosynthesis C-methylase UbiE